MEVQKILDSLTQDQLNDLQAHRSALRDKLDEYYKNFGEINRQDLEKYTHELYQMSGLKDLKEVIVLQSPLACLLWVHFMKNGKEDLARKLQNGEITTKEANEYGKDKSAESASTYANFSDMGWLVLYDYILNVLKMELSDETMKNYEILKGVCMNTFYSIQLENYCLVSEPPLELHRGNDSNLHYTQGPAILFKDGAKNYFINGRYVEKENFEPYIYPFDDEEMEVPNQAAYNHFIKEQNEEAKAAMVTVIIENCGRKGLLKFLKADMVDEEVIEHKDEEGRVRHTETVRLYKTKEKFSFLNDRFKNPNQPFAWLEETCPSTGTVYLIDTSADFTKAVDAIKFSRGKNVPFELPYNWKSFSN